MGDLDVCSSPRPNGDVLGEYHVRGSSPPLPASNPDPDSIGAESWDAAERATHEVVCRIHPTLGADYKRKEVIEYVQGLIRSHVGCEVFPYGSVPLKTFLPDGDIDLSAFGSPNVEDSLVSDVHAILKGEEHNEAAPYEVKDVHCIDAEVKLVKCIVQNIVVDISFNQLGGLCTLCFLEQVDRLVGKDHLFKCSIILTKAWCYYESRILGAHHGLISTYALETMVLYIFHLFHTSLNGPLAVLYRFLDYFGKFDWENYCISLNGPVCRSSLPEIKAEIPENGGGHLLLTEEFLRNCVEMFPVQPRGLETNVRAFPQKHLNIIDPLKENNNLGRSVNRGNFYRIRSALKYGARKLGWILSLPRERIDGELKMFFSNTLDRHEISCWTDFQNPSVASGAIGIDFGKDEILSIGRTDDPSHCSPLQSKLGTLVFGDFDHATHFSSSGLFPKNEKIGNCNCQKMPANSMVNDESFSTLWPEVEKKQLGGSNLAHSCIDQKGRASTCSVVFGSVGNIQPSYGEGCNTGVPGSTEALKWLLELSGDYDTHFRNLQYGQFCLGYAVSSPLQSMPPVSHSLHNVHSHIREEKGFALGQQCYSYPASRCSTHGLKEKKKPRGMGTYFPKLKCHPHTDRSAPETARNHAVEAHGLVQRDLHNNGLAPASRPVDLSDDGDHELSYDEFPVLCSKKSGSSDSHQSVISKWGFSFGNGLPRPSDKLEFGSQPQHLGAPLPKESTELELGIPHFQDSSPAVENPKSLSRNSGERVKEQLYHLKDEDEFPPLSH